MTESHDPAHPHYGPDITPFTSAAHVFVTDLERPRLDDVDLRHLARVLRLPAGADVTACDGRGTWRPCRLGRDADLEIAGDLHMDPRPEPQLGVAFALVKGERPELVVQKLTELGIDRISPFVAERSIVRWDANKVQRQSQRFVTISREAAMQCRRCWLPEVTSPDLGFKAVASQPGAALADRDGQPPSLATPALLIGPEGGWTPAERAAGLPSVRLGSHVLRAETAAFTAGALLAALRSQLVS